MMRVTSCSASHTSCRKVFGFFGGIRFLPNISFLLSRSFWSPERPERVRYREKNNNKRRREKEKQLDSSIVREYNTPRYNYREPVMDVHAEVLHWSCMLFI